MASAHLGHTSSLTEFLIACMKAPWSCLTVSLGKSESTSSVTGSAAFFQSP